MKAFKQNFAGGKDHEKNVIVTRGDHHRGM
jgi:hypothetical protein